MVFVIIGPFNEHMLEKGSLKVYNGIKSSIAAWLEQNNIPYLIFPALPSEYYADASHPVKEGYAFLAAQLLKVLK